MLFTTNSAKNSDKKELPLTQCNDVQKNNTKLPTLLMTPIFDLNSSWPSYLIKPVYDNCDIKQNDNHYYNTFNNLAKNVTSYSHVQHLTPTGTQMFPTIPYYIPQTKIGESIPSTMYNQQPLVYNNNVSVPIAPIAPIAPITNPETDRQQQLWYYQYYQPHVYNNVV